ncbi:hypothetical protein GCM10011514_44570 [Emticicia aquatilis]|uniref:Uncharacterized protein n=1 Tax=Emticicia aquatilis TaxID=1537369 RepID=A0A916Z4M7_9BACT|nr:hypothetical protein [Emticicia aquatilis]GGD75743.1 hypothetical protein GCM10011514_44570 [Emticicia aquatilis]
MMYFLETLKYRNESLFYFGLLCFILAIIFLILTRFTTTQVYNVNAWYKSFKFAASTVLFVWTMAWFIGYLIDFNATVFNWIIIITLGFEIIYITWQASRGSLSHFNVSTSFYAFMYSMMALAATIATLAAAYIGILFLINNFPDLPPYYVWSIRLGIFIFVVFAFEGFVMGSRMSHTIGGPDGEAGIPILNWSKKFGDPRIAHFIGMHALQVLPVLSYYLLRNTQLTIIVGILYFLLAVFTLMQALRGKSVFG